MQQYRSVCGKLTLQTETKETELSITPLLPFLSVYKKTAKGVMISIFIQAFCDKFNKKENSVTSN